MRDLTRRELIVLNNVRLSFQHLSRPEIISRHEQLATQNRHMEPRALWQIMNSPPPWAEAVPGPYNSERYQK